MIKLNDEMYTRCPRAIQLDSLDARHIVNLYFQCKDFYTLPYAGGPAEQTAFLMDAFAYLDDLRADTAARRRKATA